jgi:hypothetical protein
VCSGLSEEEEDEEGEEGFLRSKKALQLLRNLATIMPGNFRSAEVSEELVTLLESEDKEIGEFGWDGRHLCSLCHDRHRTYVCKKEMCASFPPPPPPLSLSLSSYTGVAGIDADWYTH